MIRKLYPFLGEHKPKVLFCILFTIIEVVCEIRLPLYMSQIVDYGISSGDMNYILLIGAKMVLVALIAIAAGVSNAKFSADASQGMAANLREGLFHKTHEFSFANIDAFSGASLVTRMTSDVTQIQNSFMMSLRMLTRAPIMLIGAFVIAVSINAQLSMSILIAIVVLFAGSAIVSKLASKLFTLVQKKLDALNGTVQENLIGIRVVKAFVREAHERFKFKKSNDELMQANLRAGAVVSLVMPIMMLVMSATTISVIWFGGNFVGNGVMTTGELISFTSYIMQILISVMMVAMVLIMLTRARACALRAIEVLEAQPTVEDPEQSGRKVRRGRIEFKDVSFGYSEGEEKDVLSDIDLTIEPGQFVGIIGGTGSGKTSLVNLIARFYDARKGEVLVDGVDVREYTQKELRDSIGMVLQKNNLFSGTIQENLRWGNEDATMDEIVKAAKDAQAHDFIESFPQGYDTDLGQGGVNVSGGQKQRLCIARAMMKKPPILILDDSTSAVDTATEAMIRRSFYENFKDSTVIIVAQRISSVRDADKIVVLDNGRIAGVGTHDELVQGNQVYQEICSSQMEGGVA